MVAVTGFYLPLYVRYKNCIVNIVIQPTTGIGDWRTYLPIIALFCIGMVFRNFCKYVIITDMLGINNHSHTNKSICKNHHYHHSWTMINSTQHPEHQLHGVTSQDHKHESRSFYWQWSSEQTTRTSILKQKMKHNNIPRNVSIPIPYTQYYIPIGSLPFQPVRWKYFYTIARRDFSGLKHYPTQKEAVTRYCVNLCPRERLAK
jgi:hypothetical protein